MNKRFFAGGVCSLLICRFVFAQIQPVWIPLENLSESAVLSKLETELKKYDPLVLDDPANKAKADAIENEVRLFIQQEEQKWQTQFRQVFAAVSSAYNAKLSVEASLRFVSEDLERLKLSLDTYEKQIQSQQAVIQNSEATKKAILDELSQKLSTIPFYVVMFGSALYERTRTPKEMEELIFSAARAQAVEAVNGTYIQAETQVEQYQLVKDRITATISGRVQVEQTTNNFYIRVVSGNTSQISTVGLLAVYPWSAPQTSLSSATPLPAAANLDIFPVDNATFSRLKAYPSGFVQDAQSFLEKAKSQNLTFQSQLRSLLSEVRTRLEQEEQAVIQAKTILERLESERRFYRQAYETRMADKVAIQQKLAPLEEEFKKANDAYRAFLSRRSVYQFQTDFKLDDYNLSADQMYSGILRNCFDRFKNNIREEFLSWVTVVNFNQLTDYRESRREIPARLEAVRILYPYAQNNLDGRPTRGILIVFKARFDMGNIPDYTPGGTPLKTGTAFGRGLFRDKAGIEFVFIQGGTFDMGDTFGDGDSDEKPVHRVTVSDFYLSKTEVTNAQYAAFLNEYGSDKVKSGEYAGQTMIYGHEWGVQKKDGVWVPAPGYENHPVVNVTWYGAYEFCRYYGYRLPTEAEWEYAARGGNVSKGYIYAGSNTIDDVAWYDGNSHPVGTKQPNELGLYDMSGNVWEWCSDWYKNKYKKSPSLNPQGPPSGTNRVLRGGSWNFKPRDVRCSNRSGLAPGYGSRYIGFRVARNK